MKERIIKDIRIYESSVANIAGNSLPKELGEIFYPTKETIFIAQIIARKLNELQFACGDFDHIYINLTTVLAEDKIAVSNREIDKRIKYVDVGFNPEKVTKLSDHDKDDFIKKTVFCVLKHISSGKGEELVQQVEQLINEYGSQIKIHYKTKETASYKIDISYQIASAKNGTNVIIDFTDKKNNAQFTGNYKLHFYDDIYCLIDTLQFAGGKIILKPKKSVTAEMSNKRYKTPVEFNLNELEKI